MTPPTHLNLCRCWFVCELLRIATDFAGMASYLVGGVMTPPYS